jgi:squalene-hopene/tetraprenyl-beta-curcumene cyclase
MSVFASILGACLFLSAGDGRTPQAPAASDVYVKPTAPLDDRVQPEKITSSEPPALASALIQPMPPAHRIATRIEQVPMSKEHWEKAHAALQKGLEYLRKSQDPNGAWLHKAMTTVTDQPEKPVPMAVAVTAMIVKAFEQARTSDQEDVTAALALRYILSARQEDGSFDPSNTIGNYVNSVVASALASTENHHYSDQLQAAIVWLKKGQWDHAEGISPEQDWYGGAGYGKHGRPDMSNTQMMLEALYDAGVSPEDPAVQRATAFLARAQNLKSANNAAWAQAGANDGGFVYTPANGGESMASEAAGEGRSGEKIAEGMPRSLRSYGSMTYAGLKSMLYAGLTKDDVRVRAAVEWIGKHFSFTENPGLGQQGLYYYLHVMSRALRAAQQDVITDESGKAHQWREELIDALVKSQAADGSWVNTANRWEETRPELVTAYALLALEEALKPVREVE